MLDYKAIEIFTAETARVGNKPVCDAVVQLVSDLKIAARCIVQRGIAGSYENGAVATGRLEVLALNLPLQITIVLPVAETERVLHALSGMIDEGIVALRDLTVFAHKTRTSFFPPQLRVRDVMTPDPQSVSTDTSLFDVASALLSSVFTGVPVLDEQRRPVGVVTQGDLMRKGGLPLRLGLLAAFEGSRVEALLTPLRSRRAGEVMTAPAVSIGQDQPLVDAVQRMLVRKVKRLPAVDKKGRLTGMLSRLDVFRTVMKEAPDWASFSAQKIEVGNLKSVGEILRRDAHTVFPETPVEEVIQLIDSNDIQRVAVVDNEQTLLGIIADKDLLHFFQGEQGGILRRLAKGGALWKKEGRRETRPGRFRQTTAGEVMTRVLTTVGEQTLVEEAIALMIEKGFKRLPVVDEAGRFKGMVSRASLLRTGFGEPER